MATTTFYPDVSRWRPGLPLTGAPAVCAKVTEGTDITDPEYAPCKARAGRAGVLFFAFHFLRRGNPAGQAKWCHDHNGGVPLMVDCERRYDQAAGIDSRPQLDDVTGFVDAYRKLGGVVWLVYLPHWYWQDYMRSPSLRPLQDRHLWLVSSNYVTSYSDTGPGWDSYGGMSPKIWQYTDRKPFGGQTVDFNAYRGDAGALRSLVTTGKEQATVATAPAAKPKDHRLTEHGGWVDGVTHHRTGKCNRGGMQVPSGVMGVVMHTMVGFQAGTDSIFTSGPIQSSAHFGIDSKGGIIQWVSVRGDAAWHCAAGNANWYGIEHEDGGHPERPLTEAQLNSSAQLVELLSRDNLGRFALDVAGDTRHEGMSCHYMGGAAWGGHTCPDLVPGKGPRSGQRAEIIKRARALRATGQFTTTTPAPPAPATQGDEDMPSAIALPTEVGQSGTYSWATGTNAGITLITDEQGPVVFGLAEFHMQPDPRWVPKDDLTVGGEQGGRLRYKFVHPEDTTAVRLTLKSGVGTTSMHF